MTLNIGILMDSINTINTYKDSTFAMMLSAQDKGHNIFYFQQKDLSVLSGNLTISAQKITVRDQLQNYYQAEDKKVFLATDFDSILMRKDPPFDMEYIYTTYLLDLAEKQGVKIINPPNALRTVNEKFFINYFPSLTPKTLVSRDTSLILDFIKTHQKAVLKPMDGMGGTGIFKVNYNDPNTFAIIEALGNGDSTIMAQAYLDNVTQGDKRILLVNGEPAEFGLARIPQGIDFRANLAAGGIGEVQSLTQKEIDICNQIKPTLNQLGLVFVGLDVIDGHITEINVTSPTCIREIHHKTGINIANQLISAIEGLC